MFERLAARKRESEPAVVLPEGLERALRPIVDPDVGLSIVDMGMIREAAIEGNAVRVVFTPTAPMCPYGEHLAASIEAAVWSAYPDVDDVHVVLSTDPPWSPEWMTDAGKRALGWR